MTGSASPGGLTTARDATERLQAAGLQIVEARPTYVRHKPGETTIIAYRFALADGGTTWGYAHWCADPRRADQIHDKARSLRPRPSPVGAGLTRVDPQTVVYGFPNDARLRRLRWYVEPRKLKRSLAPLVDPDEQISGRRSTVGILRYKPERRVLVARVDLTTTTRTRRLLVRYTTQRQADGLAAMATHLRCHGVDTPAPIARLEDDRVAVDQFIDGRQLREVVRTEGADGAELALALRRFHATPPLADCPRRTAVSELASVLEGLRGLTSWQPALADVAADTAALLSRTRSDEPDATVLLHGDLHAKNVLVTDAGISFVDLERVAVGAPAIDLGYFNAHAIALGIRQPNWSPHAPDHAATMIDAYQQAAAPVSDEQLAWHTAIGLVEQALLVTRHLEPRWQATSRQLLDAAGRQLRDCATLTAASA